EISAPSILERDEKEQERITAEQAEEKAASERRDRVVKILLEEFESAPGAEFVMTFIKEKTNEELVAKLKGIPLEEFYAQRNKSDVEFLHKYDLLKRMPLQSWTPVQAKMLYDWRDGKI